MALEDIRWKLYTSQDSFVKAELRSQRRRVDRGRRRHPASGLFFHLYLFRLLRPEPLQMHPEVLCVTGLVLSILKKNYIVCAMAK